MTERRHTGAVETRLRRAHRRVLAAVAEMDAAKAELLQAVRDGRAAGLSLADLAAVLDVKKARAQQLARQAAGRGRNAR